ncbi:phage tail terminator family protein [Paenibacillus ginsengihumi]|uniref:phage tail terminator family protein n=1 Tax=Paenibacillus ginsengihumi TaxID=431596 RepID=UPI00035F941C|nr:hypothetical protein [Paenibacillus ginsengihumi]
MQVTINGVRHAVHEALRETFPLIPVFSEEIEQTHDPPYFVVRLLEPVHTRELGRRYRRDHPFVVRYFSAERSSEDMYSVAEQLTSALKWITIGGSPWPGQGMSFQITDAALQFMVTYRLLVWEQQPDEPKMQHLKQEGNANEQKSRTSG